ncbi:2-keto-4-pentenoate hydratase/2-oxohepta-3-ene-1,7-dioic acid hydratase (catechol pathway) [Pseudomonas citronellolis]|uniref:2-keto-4-pentenoate hydratase/2-oxohepta-3-ene-1,7-dioic acid hydratase (Catechol pathway) n=1 Tax=Pseudomonas citronellolis TaxID=53408 RepID=A0AAQ1KFX9_9PSED|nr:fumarylacetoacetate hydrolase family protein [Pseudomonas citronellolis]TGC21515.1 FAA hydrolase family protein [Pseudomonas citronellolis]SFC93454.1 2-keto-4-pentenoate hydratase/2-oxohepta-3-ene-1,7-dioic acid hydratase (catechol pathway) [Pseudomonas citronellolis]
MKLCTFKTPGGLVGVGIVNGDGIIRVADHLSAAPRDMAGLIGEWQFWQEPLQRLAQIQKADFVLDEVTLLAPLPRPGKILGIGLNYADHVAESGMATPADQLWFAMMNTAANGPYAPIDLPLVSEQLDYEAEMVFVIGKRCRHVSREQARDAIFGYCVGNDVSVRDWQLRTSQFVLGKSFDGHAPFGPWLVTPDEVGNPHELGIRCFVNDEQRQESNTRELIFDCYQQVEHLSKVMTLEPGDVIFSGTPGGVGAGFKPPRWLREGDRVRVEIDGLGAIENVVRAERAVGDGHAR